MAVGDALDVVPDAVVVTPDDVGNGGLVVIESVQTAQVHAWLDSAVVGAIVAVGNGVPVVVVAVYPAATGCFEILARVKASGMVILTISPDAISRSGGQVCALSVQAGVPPPAHVD